MLMIDTKKNLSGIVALVFDGTTHRNPNHSAN